MYPDLSNTVISACSSSLRILAAAVAPPATPPTITIFILFFYLSCISSNATDILYFLVYVLPDIPAGYKHPTELHQQSNYIPLYLD